MGEFSQIMQIVAEQIKSASPQMEVVNAFPNAPGIIRRKKTLQWLGFKKFPCSQLVLRIFVVRAFRYEAKKPKSGSKSPFAARVPSSAGKAGKVY